MKILNYLLLLFSFSLTGCVENNDTSSGLTITPLAEKEVTDNNYVVEFDEGEAHYTFFTDYTGYVVYLNQPASGINNPSENFTWGVDTAGRVVVTLFDVNKNHRYSLVSGTIKEGSFLVEVDEDYSLVPIQYEIISGTFRVHEYSI